MTSSLAETDMVHLRGGTEPDFYRIGPYQREQGGVLLQSYPHLGGMENAILVTSGARNVRYSRATWGRIYSYPQ
jgi:hypothetical protein